mmetsp:Transcript_27968/g.94166  ORF Transcript_27968/g.94166 Transcript_27968/m.94166 type:complete len:207 (+) Transcript_27968:66-686(+)
MGDGTLTASTSAVGSPGLAARTSTPARSGAASAASPVGWRPAILTLWTLRGATLPCGTCSTTAATWWATKKTWRRTKSWSRRPAIRRVRKTRSGIGSTRARACPPPSWRRKSCESEGSSNTSPRTPTPGCSCRPSTLRATPRWCGRICRRVCRVSSATSTGAFTSRRKRSRATFESSGPTAASTTAATLKSPCTRTRSPCASKDCS